MTRRSQRLADEGDKSSADPDNLNVEDEPQQPAGLKSRPQSARRARRPSNLEWNHMNGANGKPVAKLSSKDVLAQSPSLPASSSTMKLAKRPFPAASKTIRRYGAWPLSLFAILVAALGILIFASILRSTATSQVEPKGCRMSYMRPSFIHYKDFDTEHTRFASKYSLYLYREEGLDDGSKVTPQSHALSKATYLYSS